MWPLSFRNKARQINVNSAKDSKSSLKMAKNQSILSISNRLPHHHFRDSSNLICKFPRFKLTIKRSVCPWYYRKMHASIYGWIHVNYKQKLSNYQEHWRTTTTKRTIRNPIEIEKGQSTKSKPEREQERARASQIGNRLKTNLRRLANQLLTYLMTFVTTVMFTWFK